jgi:hypothetical protein
LPDEKKNCAMEQGDARRSRGNWVDELYTEASSGVWIRTSGDETLAGCVPDSSVFLRLHASAAGFKEIYATLLAAQLAERRVSIRVNPGSNPCSVAYVTLNRNNW